MSTCWLGFDLDVLSDTGAHHQDECGKLNILTGSLWHFSRPVYVLPYESGWMYDVVVVVDIAEECFNKGILCVLDTKTQNGKSLAAYLAGV
jgi:hypothetical protein